MSKPNFFRATKAREVRFKVKANSPIFELIFNAESPSDELQRLAEIGARWQKADNDPVGVFSLTRHSGVGSASIGERSFSPNSDSATPAMAAVPPEIAPPTKATSPDAAPDPADYAMFWAGGPPSGSL